MLCDSNQPSFSFSPTREKGGRDLGKEAMGGTKQEQQQQKSVLRWGWGGAEEETQPFWKRLIMGGRKCRKRIQRGTRGTGAAPWLRAAVLWLLPQVQSCHPRMQVPGTVQNRAFLEEAPCCLQRSDVVEGGQVKTTLENCESINRSQVRITTLPSIGIQEQYPSHSLGIPKSQWLVKMLLVVLCMSVNSTVIQTFIEC